MLLRDILHVVTVRHTKASSNKTQNIQLLGSFCGVRPGLLPGALGQGAVPHACTCPSRMEGRPPWVSGLCLHICSDVPATGTKHRLRERLPASVHRTSGLADLLL